MKFAVVSYVLQPFEAGLGKVLNLIKPPLCKIKIYSDLN